MPKKLLSKQDIVRLLITLEMMATELDFLDVPSNFDTMKATYDAFRERCRKQRRKLAKLYHPDIGGDVERFKAINDACDTLIGLELRPKPRPQANPFPGFRAVRRPTFGGATAANSGTVWTSNFVF
jgi:hypothetical protein